MADTKRTAATLKELAPLIGKCYGTVLRWAKEGMPRGPNGWDPDEVRQWRSSFYAARANNHPERMRTDRPTPSEVEQLIGDTEIDLGEAQRRYRIAKARSEELKLAQMEGELMTREEVKRLLSYAVASAKRAFLVLGRRIAADVAGVEPRQAQRIIEAAVVEILRDLAGAKMTGGANGTLHG